MINMNFMFELYSKPHMRGYLFTLIWCGQLRQLSLPYLRILLFLFIFVLNSESFNEVTLKTKLIRKIKLEQSRRIKAPTGIH